MKIYRIFIAFLLVEFANGQGACPVGGLVTGPGVGVPYVAAVIPLLGQTYILHQEGTFNCFGVILEWMFVVPGGCPALADFNVRFEVWRGASPTYTLVGYNTYDPAMCIDLGGGDVTLGIPADEQIPFEPGYMIGWSWISGTVTIAQSTAAPAGLIDIMSTNAPGCFGITPGATCTPDLPGVPLDHVLQVTLVQGPPPTIGNLDAVVGVLEDEPVGYIVHTVLASHPSQTQSALGFLENNAVNLVFTVSNTDFTITNTGTSPADIQTAISLDYESQLTYTMTVTVTALGLTDSGSLTLNILDVNEPHVINPAATVYVAIADPCTTTSVFTVTYTDPDAVDPTNPKYFSLESYTLTNPVQTNPSPVTPFLIDGTTGEVFCTAALATWRTEDGMTHDLDLLVNDAIHRVPSVLTVELQQTIDPPAITNLPLTHAVNEDILPGVIFTVHGTSHNLPMMRFSITDVNPRSHYYHFSIDPISGDISLEPGTSLDVRAATTILITVNIEDDLYATTETVPLVLTLDIQWINKDPEYLPDEYYVTIYEECYPDVGLCNATPGTFAWELPNLDMTVYDRDVTAGLPTGAPDVLTCTVLPSHGSNFFDFQGAGQPVDCTNLFIVERLDIDSSPENEKINLTTRAQDSGGPTHGSVAKVYVTVVDINDNQPVFTSPGNPYTATIPENTPGGVNLFQVSATDMDSGINAELTFSLRDSTNPVDPLGTEYFQIDPVTGLVTTKQAVDYETYTQIPFTIRASDAGQIPGLLWRDEAAIVYITNVNDLMPTWDTGMCNSRAAYFPYNHSKPCFFNDELRDDTLVNYHVMTIAATDVDTPNGDLTYHFLEPNIYFRLGVTSGRIEVNSSLSTYVKYILYCYSQDNRSPNLLTEPHLRVRIDTFDPERQLIDIVLEIPLADFNNTSVQEGFLVELENILRPWFPKIDKTSLDKDKTTVTIYALKDNSTYDEDNLHLPKHFVDRDDLLDVLRKDFFGTPSDSLQTPPFDPYGPILVEPTYPVWLLDTVPGLVTLALICLAALGLIIGLTVGLCYKYKKCCFKKKHPIPENRNWGDPPDKSRKPSKSEPKYDQLDNESTTRPPPRERAGSVDTIHSLLYDNRGADT